MKKNLKYLLAAALLLSAFLAAVNLSRQQPETEIIRKLSGLRLSLELYRMKEKSLPRDFSEVVKKGYLEDIPVIKLKWRPGNSSMKHRASFRPENTGSWAYVNDPKDENFGLIHIDSLEKDPRGRYWSEL